MTTQHRNIHQYLKDILIYFHKGFLVDFVNANDRYDIDFISFGMKCLNVNTHAHMLFVVKCAWSESVFESAAWLRYQNL